MSQLVSQVKQELDKLVAEGKLTQEKATAYLAKYETNLKTIMADTTVRQPRAGAPKTPRTNVTPKKPL
jgi:polyhydroxyalkanoate synthesis regulator phasin